MAQANFPLETSEFIEILDEEFDQHVQIAKILMNSLKKPQDKEICSKYIRKCLDLKSPSIEVKTNRNEFFKYFLKMLQTAVLTQPPQYDDWFRPQMIETSKEKETSYWSADKKTYVAAKTIPGYGTLVYMAVSYKPELGWQPYGFSSYEF